MGFIDELGEMVKSDDDIASEHDNKCSKIKETVISVAVSEIKNKIKIKVQQGEYKTIGKYKEVIVEYDFMNSYDYVQNLSDGPSVVLVFSCNPSEGQKIFTDGVVLYTSKSVQIGWNNKGHLKLTPEGVAIIKQVKNELEQDGIAAQLYLHSIDVKNGWELKHVKKDADFNKPAKYSVRTSKKYWDSEMIHVFYGLRCSARF